MRNIKTLWIVVVLMLTASTSFAQRFAYVDSEYILTHIPEYVNAQKQLDALSTTWQKDIDAQFAEIEEMYQAYQEDQAQLSDDMRRRREDMIVNKEREVKELQRQKFGFEGDLFKERSRLIGPIQEKVTKAIQAIAERQNLDVILDKGAETFLYSNPKIDKSDEVIVQLGYKP